MITNNATQSFYFEDPRLMMTLGGRMLVRVLSVAFYTILVVAAGLSFLAETGEIKWIGIFLVVFLIDRVFHLEESDRPLYEMPRGGAVNLASYLSPSAFRIIERAFERTVIQKGNLYLEILSELLPLPNTLEALERLDIEPAKFQAKLKEKISEVSKAVGEPFSIELLKEEIKEVVLKALLMAEERGAKAIEATDILSAMGLVNEKNIHFLLSSFSIDSDDLSGAAFFAGERRKFKWHLPHIISGFFSESDRRIRHRVVNRAWTSRATPILDRYGKDLTDIARQGGAGFLIGHEKEYKRLIETLARPINPNALLIGEPGIGKETVVAHLAFELIKDRVPKALFDRRLVQLDLSAFVAGASPEELQSRLRGIVQEIIESGNIILFIPEIHNLVHTSGAAYLSVADALMPILMNSTFPVIGTTFPREMKQLIEPRTDFYQIFESIRVEEITQSEAEKILTYHALLLERDQNIVISFGAIKTAVLLAKKYFQNKFLPGSAEELLKSAVVAAERNKIKLIGPNEVKQAAEEKSNIPIHEVGKEEAQKLLSLEDTIHEKLIDQAEAVSAVSSSLREYRAGISRKGGPIASFLFVGPTGVGKTELAKILTAIQFGSEKLMLRFDMTEYQNKESLARFIGSTDGTISGTLTDAVREKPYGMVLLDEFEKAHPDILNLFLQVLDDGRLTDSFGRTVDFQNTIIIATSNAHSDLINSALREGKSMSEIAENLKRNLTDVFKPELINRFSKVIIFKDLSPEEIKQIAKLNLSSLIATVGEQGISLEFGDAAVAKIAELGYNPAFGARPLRRVIDEKIRAPLADAILRGTIGRGGKARVEYENGEFVFKSVV